MNELDITDSMFYLFVFVCPYITSEELYRK